MRAQCVSNGGISYQKNTLNDCFVSRTGGIICLLMTNRLLISLSCRGKLKAIKIQARQGSDLGLLRWMGGSVGALL